MNDRNEFEDEFYKMVSDIVLYHLNLKDRYLIKFGASIYDIRNMEAVTGGNAYEMIFRDKEESGKINVIVQSKESNYSFLIAIFKKKNDEND
jgi:hypothetical protein